MVYEQIKSYLEDNGIKHAYVAAKMGMSKQLFSSKVNGKTNFTADEYINLCHVLKLDLNHFDSNERRPSAA